MSAANMSNHNTASVRTFVNSAVAMALALVASKVLDRQVSINEAWIVLIVPGILVGVHRASLVISEKVPWVGYILFGVNRSPAYTDPPPAVPALANDPEPAA